MKFAVAVLAACLTSVNAGTVLWDGFWGSDAQTSDFDKWSFSNEVGKWQWYIHGSQPTTRYLGLDVANKNPADTSDAKGCRTTIDTTAFWNGQNMARTEILPQTKANLGQGHLYYHFSLKTSTTNAPNPDFEHQIAFFESHFTELKFGKLSGATSPDSTLRWMISGVTKWSTPLTANTWYNFAYDIDFSAGTVGLWASTGSDPLKQVVANQKGSPSTNSADFHIGVLRLPNGGTQTTEDYFWSGVYVEQAPITTNVAGPAAGSFPAGPSSPTTAAPTSTVQSSAPASSAPATSTASGPTQTQWGQCGGNGYTGPTVCASPFKCVAVSPPYYSQCQ